jgi:hypothetical protein
MKTKWIGIALLSAVVLAGSLAGPTQAKESQFESEVVGSIPNQSAGGLNAGGVLWVVREGEAKVEEDGLLEVSVEGLLLGAGTSQGTTGTITSLRADVVCGGTVAAVTASAPLSAAGDFEVSQVLTLPKPCRGLMVLLEITPARTPSGTYIAITGTP